MDGNSVVLQMKLGEENASQAEKSPVDAIYTQLSLLIAQLAPSKVEPAKPSSVRDELCASRLPAISPMADSVSRWSQGMLASTYICRVLPAMMPATQRVS
mmetsp:Transcript_31733/g.52483  ORF Transcript_31733/g.52483 Transcript_31733/m.52483 type:complete len:100 (-) Transcript_31733:178-477(-)